MTHPRALVVRGGWAGHRPVEATEMFLPFLERHGYTIRVEESPAVYADADEMARTDLIVQCMTMAEIGREQVDGLRAAVTAGTGFTGWHGGIADSYRASADYLQLVGGQFATHPSKEPGRCGHGQEDNYLPYTVQLTPLGREHPITAGLADFDLETEQYWVLHDDLIDVLATTTHPVRPWHPWHRPIVSPAIWTRQWGAGRIVVTTPGHSLDVLENPNVRTVIERGHPVGDPHGIGIVGLGHICGAYLDTLAQHPAVRIAAVADLDAARAATVAAGLPGCRALSVDRLLADPEVRTVLNLTVPAAHAEIALGAIGHGKQVYGEKPLAAELAAAREIVDRAAAQGLLIGCAPDTVLGTGTQTARAAIDGGLIGRPLAASAVMVTAGHERWHPNPDFYYVAGGGPLLDMGPYYVSALVQLLGPVRAVIGSASRLRAERIIGSGPRAGQRIPVEVDSHVSGVLAHDSGVLSTLTTSFDGVQTTAAPIEVHGADGTLAVPDPNQFDGDVRLFARGAGEWRTLPPSAGWAGAARGIGLLDLVAAADQRRPPRAGAALALHVLDAMTALLRSAAEGRRIELTTTADRPDPMPLSAL